MMDFELFIEVEKAFRPKAVMRQLIELYGLYKEKVLLRGEGAGSNSSSAYSEVQYYGRCDNLARVAATIATKENELLFNLIAQNCCPLRSREIDIWLDNFTELSDVLIIASDNIIAGLSGSGKYNAQEKNLGYGFRGTYRKDSYYLPVHSIGDRQEMEMLILKTTKFGILLQHIPMPVKFDGLVAKTIFHANDHDEVSIQENAGFREIFEYVPPGGFLGYFLQIPPDGNYMHYKGS